jgi:hypothetical protein
MMPAIHRRWFRFSLRTMFIVFTTFACWLAYELNWIRQRHAFIDGEDRRRIQGDRYMIACTRIPGEGAPFASSLLWVLGESAHSGVVVWADAVSFDHLSENDQQRVDRVRSLFPEASKIFVATRAEEVDETATDTDIPTAPPR